MKVTVGELLLDSVPRNMSNKNISSLFDVNELAEYTNIHLYKNDSSHSYSRNEYGSTLASLENKLQSSWPESIKKIWYQKSWIIALVSFSSLLVMALAVFGIFQLIKNSSVNCMM